MNKDIRASSVRLIDAEGEQVGIVSIQEARERAQTAGLDLIEVVPNATPPVCKIIDYGKFRYNQTKKEKENKKAQHQIKVKEVKVKPNIDQHDFMTKVKHAKTFLEKGNKVKVSCMFRGREMAHQDVGYEVVKRFIQEVEEWGTPDAPLKLMGRFLSVVLAPVSKKVKTAKTKITQSPKD
ncbi:MAG: translation initiation factor IF-3 [Chlamydiales bacterium]|nr:translation initiation factor IF-3 [Chlamydiales bacterium]